MKPYLVFLVACLTGLLSFSIAQEDFDEANQDALIIYTVQGDTLLNPVENWDAATDDELKDILLDQGYHQVLWQDFAGLIPLEYRKSITRLAIFTDGEEEILASVTPNADDYDTWTLALDALDGTYFGEDLIQTMIHEFGHIVFLMPAQVPRNLDVLQNEEDDALYEEAVDACPTYFTGEGCSIQSSYVYAFYQRFWTELYDQLDSSDESALYDAYPEQFVSDYASTNPDEDMAESWTFFVFNEKPEADSIANEKILFFYQYPELIDLRDQIRERMPEF